jgi:DMSO reductase anchor subunit
MDNNDAQKKYLISIAIKIFIVIGIGTLIAFWHLGQL